MTTADITTPSVYPNSSPTSSLLSSAPSSSRKTLLNGAKIGIVTSMVFGVILAVPIGLILSRRRKVSRSVVYLERGLFGAPMWIRL